MIKIIFTTLILFVSTNILSQINTDCLLFFDLGSKHRIVSSKAMDDGNYVVNIVVTSEQETYNCLLILSAYADSIGCIKIAVPDRLISDYNMVNNEVYVLYRHSCTMGCESVDIISKYNIMGDLLFEQHILGKRTPTGSSKFHFNTNHEILIASEVINAGNSNLSIFVYNLNGKLESENVYPANKTTYNPQVILENEEFEIFLITKNYNASNNKTNTIISKLNEKGNIIWNKTLDDIYPKKAIVTKDNNIIIYGYSYVEDSRIVPKVIKIDTKCNIIWEKEITSKVFKGVGDIIEDANENYYFSGIIYNNIVIQHYIHVLNNQSDYINEMIFDHKVITGNQMLLLRNPIIENLYIIRTEAVNNHHDRIVIHKISK